MEKREVLQQPIKVHIDGLQLRNQAREIADSLASLSLTKEAPVLTKGSKALAIPEDAVGQLEKLGRMSLRIGSRDIYELQTYGVGESLSRDVSFVRDFVLPEEDKILPLSIGNIVVRKGERATMLNKIVFKKYRDRTMLSLLADIANRKKDKDVKLLRSYSDEFDIIFDREMSIEKVLDTNWEMVCTPHSVISTRHYLKRVRENGARVFDVHVHHSGIDSPPSITDAWGYAGPNQRIEWAGILHVVRPSLFLNEFMPQFINFAGFGRFEFAPGKLSAYYSSPEDVEWLRKAISELSKDSLRSRFVRGLKERLLFTSDELREFEKEHTARVMTYGKLLEEAG